MSPAAPATWQQAWRGKWVERGLVALTDINGAMLERGRDRLIDAGLADNVRCVQANAEQLPFADDSFHCVTIGFGLRNVTDKPAALASMHRVLKPGGQLDHAGILAPRAAPGCNRSTMPILSISCRARQARGKR